MNNSRRLSGGVCVLRLTYLLLVLSICSTTWAGTIFVSGDETPLYYGGGGSGYDNNVFFENILDGGDTVVIHDPVNPNAANFLNQFYNTLSGVTSSSVGDATLDGNFFTGVDLFITGLGSNALNSGELAALGDFYSSGGTILFTADYTLPFDNVNSALGALGSGLSLYGAVTDPGNNYATGASIASDPYTLGVTSFLYGATYGVSGGKGLFFDSGDRAFIAYEPDSGGGDSGGDEGNGSTAVPEPSILILIGIGLGSLALSAGRKKR